MKSVITQKSNEQIFALLAALVLAVILATGCSVAPVNGSLDKDTSVTMSFSNCMNVTTPYGLQYQCTSTATPYTTSYNQYTGHLTGLSEAAKVAAYQNYLAAVDASLDDASKAELAAKFDEVSNQVSQ